MLDVTTTKTNWNTGWENEFVVTARDGTPRDFRPLFRRERAVNGHARIVLDAGRDQFEINTNPSSAIKDHVAEMRRYMRAIETMGKEGALLHFDPRRMCGTPATAEDFFKPRLKAMLKALQHPDEGGERGLQVVESGNINAFHVHFGFRDVFSDEATQAMNLLNAATPAVTNWVHTRFGIKPANRNQVWSFSRPERQPAPRWFPDYQAFHRVFESIPRLVRPVDGQIADKHGGQWDVDLETKQTFGDDAAEACCWWGTRIRPKHGTVEYRPTPTLANPLHQAEFVVELDAWLERALTAVGDRQFGSFDEAMQSGLVPDFMDIPMPENQTAWWAGWNAY